MGWLHIMWKYAHKKMKYVQGSHFFPRMKFTDFSSIFFIFPWLLLNNFLMAFIQY